MKNKILFFFEKYFFWIVFIRDIIIFSTLEKNEKKVSNSFNIPIFSKVNYKRKGDVFFILGGGSSINSIDIRQWEKIKNNTSIGLNMFFCHEFTPTYSMIEGFRESDVNTEKYNWLNENSKELYNKSDSILLLKDISYSILDWKFFGGKSANKVFSIPKFQVPGRKNFSVRKSYRLLYKLSFLKNKFFFSRASVTLAISLGYNLGFKKIVLCGFDMNDTKYFFQSKNFKSNKLFKPPKNTGQSEKSNIHSTIDSKVSPVTVDESIYSFNEEFLAPSGVKVYVAKKTTKLYPRVKLFNWSKDV
ncbi:MAG: hypothetical protein CL832_09260 [Crocinitomicaceae bacterium]|nr:hypothetical protein [Crocinitomicaceae bacterium]|tara:strand:- start:7197 stop:8102 length:906 start_codon:yes stop_codon:yes gene_type:complete